MIFNRIGVKYLRVNLCQCGGSGSTYIDNSGFVWAHTKGSSRDDYIYTLAKCLQDFCTGIGVLVKVFHAGRRTSAGERVADALSKGNMKE